MSEEVKDAPRVVPKAMVLAVFINGVFAWFFLIALLYNMGDINDALNTSYGYPITQVFFEIARGSPAGTNGLMCFQIMTGFLSLFGTMASVSRLIWAFARDRGLPYSDFWAYVREYPLIP